MQTDHGSSIPGELIEAIICPHSLANERLCAEIACRTGCKRIYKYIHDIEPAINPMPEPKFCVTCEYIATSIEGPRKFKCLHPDNRLPSYLDVVTGQETNEQKNSTCYICRQNPDACTVKGLWYKKKELPNYTEIIPEYDKFSAQDLDSIATGAAKRVAEIKARSKSKLTDKDLDNL